MRFAPLFAVLLIASIPLLTPHVDASTAAAPHGRAEALDGASRGDGAAFLLPDSGALRDYLLDAALRWSPPSHHLIDGESAEAYTMRMGLACEAIADVALDPSEKPLYEGAFAREKTALFLVAQAEIETELHAWTQDGRCNSAAWRRSDEAKRIMKGTCDSGVAHSYWSLHVDEQGPVVLDESRQSWHRATGDEHDEAITGADVLGDVELAARVTLHWERTVPNPWGNAQGAREKARRYLAKHPFDAVTMAGAAP